MRCEGRFGLYPERRLVTVLPGLVVDVVLGTLRAFLTVVFLSMMASTLAAADLASGMDLVSVLGFWGVWDVT